MSSHPETSGFNHVATMTADLDRYLEFYGDVFGAEVHSIMEAHDDHPRMAVVNMGGGGALNVFEVPADSIVGDRTTMVARSNRPLRLGGGIREEAPRDPRSSGGEGSVSRRGDPVWAGPAVRLLSGSRWSRAGGRVPQVVGDGRHRRTRR